jgi:hypothetical protein
VRPRLLLSAVLAASLLASCRDDKPSACAKPEAHLIDPSSSQHLLPGAPEPKYNTNPPTSGAHAPGTYPTGVLPSPLANAAQVAMLEAGDVLIQYRDVSAADLRELKALGLDGAKGGVAVAPNDSLPTPIVATAWVYSMECQRFDKEALQDFVGMHTGKHQSD